MRSFIMGWTEKAEALVTGNIIWSSASQLQEQIRAHQVRLRPKLLFSELIEFVRFFYYVLNCSKKAKVREVQTIFRGNIAVYK